MKSLADICRNCSLCPSASESKELLYGYNYDADLCIIFSANDLATILPFGIEPIINEISNYLLLDDSKFTVSFTTKCLLPKEEVETGLISCSIYTRLLLRSFKSLMITKEAYDQLDLLPFPWASGEAKVFDYVNILMIEDCIDWTANLVEEYREKLARMTLFDRHNIISISEDQKLRYGASVSSTEDFNN